VAAAYSLTMTMIIMACASFRDMRGRRLGHIVGAVAIVLTLRVVDESRDPVSRRFDPAGQGRSSATPTR